MVTEKQKILIIDDDPGIIKTLSNILRIKGYELFTARNGTEGLDILKQFFLNLAIIDLGLPDMDGLEVLGRMKATNPFIEVIILTGNASLNSAIEAMNRGDFSYLLKPYDIDQLMLNIGRALERQRDHEEIAAQNIELKKINARLREVNIILENDAEERKQVEETLRESGERFRQITESVGEWIWETDADGLYTYSNSAVEEILGYKPDEIVGRMHFYDLFVPEKMEELKKTALERFAKKKIFRGFANQCLHKNGKRVILETSGVPSLDEQGMLICYRGADTDITERKHVEEKLKDSEKRFATIFLSNPAAIAITRTDNSQFVDVNLTWQDVTGYTHAEAVGHTPFELNLWVNPEQRELLIEMLREHGEAQGEIQLRKKSGEIRDMLMSAELSQLTGETYLLTMAQDITERKRVEDELIASLQEKEILIGEVHHRVKNNMQVISGLLDLQAKSTGNPELTEMLNESQRRIQAMAMIHEKLYGSRNFSRIDLAGYARILSQELFQAYEITPGKINLIIQSEGEFYVDINKAIPCGLILNELISNTLKHAFPGGEPGTLEIIIRKTENAEVEIVVRDNGLVIPDDVDIHQPRSVGLHLLNGLVIHQLDGRVEVRRDTGTEFRITFPLSFVENKGVLK